MPYLIDNREANSCCGRQSFGVVLHHALQSCAGLELCLGGVLVLGVHKFSNDALGFIQRSGIGVHLEDQLIDVACNSQGEA